MFFDMPAIRIDKNYGWFFIFSFCRQRRYARHTGWIEQGRIETHRAPVAAAIVADAERASFYTAGVTNGHHHATIFQLYSHAFIRVADGCRAIGHNFSPVPGIAAIITVHRGHAGWSVPPTRRYNRCTRHPERSQQSSVFQLYTMTRPGGHHIPVVLRFITIENIGDLFR